MALTFLRCLLERLRVLEVEREGACERCDLDCTLVELLERLRRDLDRTLVELLERVSRDVC